MAIQPQQPQSIGGVLDTTFQLYKASLVGAVPLCLLLVVASSPPSIYMMTHGVSATDPAGVLAILRSSTYWLTYLVSLILTLWIIGSLYLKVRSVGVGEELVVSAALQGGLGRVLPLVLMTLAFSIAVGIGLVLLVIPGLILMVSLILGANLVLFEGKGPIAALSGSHRLVWGDWWRTAAILTVGFIVVIVLYILAGILIGVAIPLLGFGVEDALIVGFVSGLLVNALMSVLVSPFYVALLISIYWDLKLRREGGDLAARVGALNPA
jgi:hypothetical protein